MTITKALAETTNCTFRAKKVEGTTKFFFGMVPYRLRNDLYCVEWGVKLYSLLLPTFAPDGCPPHFQIRPGAIVYGRIGIGLDFLCVTLFLLV